MKKLKKISRESMKSIFAGERGLSNSGTNACESPINHNMYGVYMGEQCTCVRTGGNWICGQCYHGGNYAIIASISNNCDQFGGFSGEGGL